MPVILYRDANYGGPSVRLQPGFYSGQRDLEGRVRGSSSGEDLTKQASSIRVDDGYIAVLYGGYSATASGGARTLVGPMEVANLADVGMDDKTASVWVYMYEPYRVAVPRDFGVTLHSTVYQASAGSGSGVHIGQGNYDRTRLDSDEVKMQTSTGIRSLCVGANTLAILYEGATFDSVQNSVVVAGQPGGVTCVQDVESELGLSGINSIRVLYAAAGGTPQSIAPGQGPWGRAIQSMALDASPTVGLSGDRTQLLSDLFRPPPQQKSLPPAPPQQKSPSAPPPQQKSPPVLTPPRPAGRKKHHHMMLIIILVAVLAGAISGAIAAYSAGSGRIARESAEPGSARVNSMGGNDGPAARASGVPFGMATGVFPRL